MAEGSNFDYLFKVRALQPGQEGQDIDWTLHAQIGRPHRRLWCREVVRIAAERSYEVFTDIALVYTGR